MKTRNEILEGARVMFNREGVMNVTLRDVAASLKRSYGNVTYHFRSKESLLFSLFEAMNMELAALQSAKANRDLLMEIFDLPRANYDITVKYLFFTTDYLQLKRTYPRLFKTVQVLNDGRKVKWKKLLLQLVEDGSFRPGLTEKNIDYIMFISASIRLAYFQMHDAAAYNKEAYTGLLNEMLKPYLSGKGLRQYTMWERKKSN